MVATAQQLNFAIRAVNEASATLKAIGGDIATLGQKASEAEAKTSRFGGALGGMAKIAGGFVLGQGLLKLPGLFGDMIGGASDLNESLSKAQVVFGDSAGEIEKFASSAAENLGITKQAALEATGTFGNLFLALGLGQQPAADMSERVLQLSADLASFNNLDPGEVLEKLRSGLVGEAEPMRSLGVNINETTVKAKAMEMGFQTVNGQLTESQKVQARYALILEQTKTAQGDFARTSGGHANQMRILKARFSDLSTEIGAVFLPVIVTVGEVLLDKVIPPLRWIAEQGIDAIRFLAEKGAALAAVAWDTISGPLGDIASVVKDMALAFADAAWTFFVEKIVPALQAVGAITWDAMKEAWHAVADAVVRLVNAGIDKWGDQVADAGAKLARIDWGDIADVLNRVREAMQPIVDYLGPKFRDLGRQLLENFKQIWEALGPLRDALVQLGEALAPLMPVLEPLAKFLMATLVVALGLVLDGIRLWAKYTTEVLVLALLALALAIEGVALAVEGLIEWLPKIAGALAEAAQAAAEKMADFYNLGAAMVDGITSAITDAWWKMRDAIWAAKDAAIGGLGSVADWLVNVAWDVMRGMMGGLVDAARSLIPGVAGSIKDTVVGGLTSAFGIFSPSRVTAEWIGRPLAAGIAAGILEGWPSIQSAIGSIVTGVRSMSPAAGDWEPGRSAMTLNPWGWGSPSGAWIPAGGSPAMPEPASGIGYYDQNNHWVTTDSMPPPGGQTYRNAVQTAPGRIDPATGRWVSYSDARYPDAIVVQVHIDGEKVATAVANANGRVIM